MKTLKSNQNIELSPWVTTELEALERVFRKALLSIEFKKFSHDEDIADRPDLFFFNGFFDLVYCHETVQSRTRRMYRINILDPALREAVFRSGFKVRVRDWAEFVECAKYNPYFNFILRASTISEELFGLAKENYGIRMPFSIDICKYLREVGEPTVLSALKTTKVFIDKKGGRRKGLLK